MIWCDGWLEEGTAAGSGQIEDGGKLSELKNTGEGGTRRWPQQLELASGGEAAGSTVMARRPEAGPWEERGSGTRGRKAGPLELCRK